MGSVVAEDFDPREVGPTGEVIPRRTSARKIDPSPIVTADAPGQPRTSQHAPRTSLRRRWAAEWEPHEATWIAWPHHQPDWPGKLGPIPWVYAEIVRVLHADERV